MPTWTEEQLTIITALQDQAAKTSALGDERYKTLTSLAKQDRDNNEIARQTLIQNNDGVVKALTARVEDLETELDNVHETMKTNADTAKAMADQNAKTIQTLQEQTQNKIDEVEALIKNLASIVEDNKACCESNTRKSDQLAEALKILQKFVTTINNHQHNDDLLAGEKMINTFRLERQNARAANNDKRSRKFNSAAFQYEANGKMGKFLSAVEDWITPYLHKHSIDEVVEEAAAVAVAEKVALEKKENLS